MFMMDRPRCTCMKMRRVLTMYLFYSVIDLLHFEVTSTKTIGADLDRAMFVLGRIKKSQKPHMRAAKYTLVQNK